MNPLDCITPAIARRRASYDDHFVSDNLKSSVMVVT
jgi:hypothetical protein